MKSTAIIAAAAAVLMLSGCLGLPENNAAITYYDFGTPIARDNPNIAEKIHLDITTPAGFDSLYIDYRLVYDNKLKRREYTASRWAENPGILLKRRLHQQFGFFARSSAQDVCLLQVDLNEFSQIFESPQKSHALLDAETRLFVGGKMRATQRFSIKRDAEHPDAASGVAALVASVDTLSAQLLAWFDALRARSSDVSQACF